MTIFLIISCCILLYLFIGMGILARGTRVLDTADAWLDKWGEYIAEMQAIDTNSISKEELYCRMRELGDKCDECHRQIHLIMKDADKYDWWFFYR